MSKKYTIKPGDTLWMISTKYLGTGSRYKEIYNLNRSTIEEAAKEHGHENSGYGLLIFPGTELTILSRPRMTIRRICRKLTCMIKLCPTCEGREVVGNNGPCHDCEGGDNYIRAKY